MSDGLGLTPQQHREVGQTVKRMRKGERRPRPQRRNRGGGSTALPDMTYFTVGSYDPTNQVITTTGTPDALPTGTPDVPAGVKIYDREAAGFSPSDTGYAIRSVAVHTDGTHGQVDWVALPTAAGQVNTVNVQLYNDTKKRTDASVEVKLLDASLSAIGDPVNCYDPQLEFSAGLATDAIGRATMVRDADTGSTRLEFTHLRGPAAWVCATLDEDMGATTSDEAAATVNSYHGLDWSNEDPADGSDDVTVLPCSGMHSGLSSGDKVVAVLKDPDTSPVEYLIVEANGSSEALIAKGTLSARVSDNYGTGTCDLGQPNGSNQWSPVLAGQEVLNPSSSPVTSDYDAPHIPVVFINGKWVATNAMDLHQTENWTTGTGQHLSHCAGTASYEWKDGDPILDIRVSGLTFQYDTACGDWTTWHTGEECEE